MIGVVDADAFAAVLTAPLVFADVVADADADVLVLFALVVLSNHRQTRLMPTATAPTTSNFNSWRIDYCPPNSKNMNGTMPLTLAHDNVGDTTKSPYIDNLSDKIA